MQHTNNVLARTQTLHPQPSISNVFVEMDERINNISKTPFAETVRFMEESAKNLDSRTTGRIFSLKIKEPFKGDHLWKALLVKGRTGLHVPGIESCDFSRKIEKGFVRVVNNSGEEKVLIDEDSRTLLFQDMLPSQFLAINRMVVEEGKQYFEAIYIKSIEEGKDLMEEKEAFKQKMVDVCIPNLQKDKNRVELLYAKYYDGNNLKVSCKL